MVGVGCLAVLCLCLVRASFADEPAVVREVHPLDIARTDINEYVSDTTTLSYSTVNTPFVEFRSESQLEWLTNVINSPDPISSNISSTCFNDLGIYREGLKNGEIWASKIYDSNGRYASQLLFDNNYWLGSFHQCSELPSPKFNVTFKIARLHLNLSKILTPQIREVLLGLCQPSSCTIEDSKQLLQSKIVNNVNGTSVTVANIREVPGKYRVLQDYKFQIFVGIISGIMLLVILASYYEYRSDINMENNKDIECFGESNKAYEKGEEMKESRTSEANNNNGNDQISQKKEPKKAKRGIGAEILLAFSAISNGRKILSVSCNSEESLTSIHGLRFFSLSWVILVHTYLQLFSVGGNKMLRMLTERSFMFQTVSNATFSVDTFFFISGLLMVYLYAKQEQRGDANRKESNLMLVIKFLKMCVYRFVRLTPAYLVVLWAVQIAMTFLRNRSVFELRVMDDYNCGNYWWRNIMYINNFFPRSQMCMLWSWYLATDTQFFTMSAIILLATKKKLKIAAGSLIVILLSAWCTTAVISYTNQYQARIDQPFAMFDQLYDKPWTRIGPYIVGMATGWLLNHIGKKNQMPLPAVLVGWGLSCLLLLSLVYGLGSGLGVALTAVYSMLGHTAWGLALAWIVIACHTGHGGIINVILSNPMLYPLSRLTFCAYLVHPLIMFLTSYIMDGSFHLHNGIIVIIFLGNTVASFLLAFLLSIGFEAPVVRIFKLLMR